VLPDCWDPARRGPGIIQPINELQTKSEKGENKGAVRATHTRKARSFLGRLKLGLRGSRQPGPEEHGSETGKPGPENVDRSRATLWHLLLLLRRRRALPPPTAPSAPLLAMLTVLSKCRGI